MASVSRSTSGLVTGKFDGESALPSCFIRNSARWRVALVEFGRLRKRCSARHGDEIGLLAEVEVGVLLPLRVLEAIVAGLGLGEWWNARAHHALRTWRRRAAGLAEERPWVSASLAGSLSPGLQRPR